MLKRFFPSESSRYKHIQNLVKRIDIDMIDRLEMFFPMWIMLAFQHYLIKSYDTIFTIAIGNDLYSYYIFFIIELVKMNDINNKNNLIHLTWFTQLL
jgi:hypothetical protein